MRVLCSLLTSSTSLSQVVQSRADRVAVYCCHGKPKITSTETLHAFFDLIAVLLASNPNRKEGGKEGVTDEWQMRRYVRGASVGILKPSLAYSASPSARTNHYRGASMPSASSMALSSASSYPRSVGLALSLLMDICVSLPSRPILARCAVDWIRKLVGTLHSIV